MYIEYISYYFFLQNLIWKPIILWINYVIQNVKTFNLKAYSLLKLKVVEVWVWNVVELGYGWLCVWKNFMIGISVGDLDLDTILKHPT